MSAEHRPETQQPTPQESVNPFQAFLNKLGRVQSVAQLHEGQLVQYSEDRSTWIVADVQNILGEPPDQEVIMHHKRKVGNHGSEYNTTFKILTDARLQAEEILLRRVSSLRQPFIRETVYLKNKIEKKNNP